MRRGREVRGRGRHRARAATGRKSGALALALVLLLASAGAGAANAAGPRLIDRERDWGIYAYQDHDEKRCYLAAHPVSRRGQTDGWTESWLLVTNDPASGFRHSISFSLGRPLRPRSTVRARVGERVFELAPEGDTAWTRDDETDLRMVVAMKRGRRMVISATAADGSRVLDSFSLMGFTKALDTTAELCRE